jgi:hypothetical protein
MREARCTCVHAAGSRMRSKSQRICPLRSLSSDRAKGGADRSYNKERLGVFRASKTGRTE